MDREMAFRVAWNGYLGEGVGEGEGAMGRGSLSLDRLELD